VGTFITVVKKIEYFFVRLLSRARKARQ